MKRFILFGVVAVVLAWGGWYVSGYLAGEPTGSLNGSDDPAVQLPAAVKAREALAERLAVPLDAVRILSTAEAVWPDGCLGLADEGEDCTQVILNGYAVSLSAQGGTYRYRTDTDGSIVRFEADPRSTLLSPESGTPAAGTCAEPPAGDLAEVAVQEDIPNPRCQRIRPDQGLRIVNRTTSTLELSFGEDSPDELRHTLSPSSSYEINVHLGDYLAPGVHRLVAEPYHGSEIWIVREFKEPDPESSTDAETD